MTGHGKRSHKRQMRSGNAPAPPPDPPAPQDVELWRCLNHDAVFLTQVEWQQHVLEFHQGPPNLEDPPDFPPARCGTCGLLLQNWMLLVYHVNHFNHAVAVQCGTCGLQFLRHDLLEPHLEETGHEFHFNEELQDVVLE